MFGCAINAYDKIIFLDFDGVLAINNPGLCDVPERDKYGTIFNHYSVDCLRQIIDETSVNIVITNYLSLRKIKKMWMYRKLLGTVVDTIRNDSMDRSMKIDNWLNKYCVNNYVIIDDMDFRQFDKHHHRHLVTTSTLTGLVENDIELVCSAMKI